jgi:L-lactate dehydrogenase complex protein LldG
MQPDKSELIEVFSRELENLAGKCYPASSLGELTRIIYRIAAENTCGVVVKQRLGIEGEEQIKAELERHGIRVLDLEECEKPVETLSTADMGITSADLLIANTGSLVMSTKCDEERLASCLPRIHVAVMAAGRIASKPPDAAQYLRQQLQSDSPSSVTFVSGPSRTADIEMKLILGVHGPHQVHVIILTS